MLSIQVLAKLQVIIGHGSEALVNGTSIAKYLQQRQSSCSEVLPDTQAYGVESIHLEKEGFPALLMQQRLSEEGFDLPWIFSVEGLDVWGGGLPQANSSWLQSQHDTLNLKHDTLNLKNEKCK